jgi:hypothetical protein
VRSLKGELPVFLRITVDHKKAEMHSGYKCTVKEWSKERQVTGHIAAILFQKMQSLLR